MRLKKRPTEIDRTSLHVPSGTRGPQAVTLTKCGKEDKCCYNYLAVGNECKECPKGTYGSECQSECDDGYYGRFCKSDCYCDLKHCDKVHGCTNEVIVKNAKTNSLPNPINVDASNRRKPLLKIDSKDRNESENQTANGSDQSPIIVAIISSIVVVALIAVSLVLITHRKLKIREGGKREKVPVSAISGIYDEIEDDKPTSTDKNRVSYAFLEESNENEDQQIDYESLKAKSTVRNDSKMKKNSKVNKVANKVCNSRALSGYDNPPPLPEVRKCANIESEEDYKTPPKRQTAIISAHDSSQ
ncbi:hypothetical protein FSP39_007094 [Pinctada imbricata]|uniref:Uncharacterized protein n=1 Tax=Pinctada imbricata TaxID=66713 RepID=A0AA88XLD4_PINIB|nr:hypothetical protein FSP39_007094 [Pinctada imbricata]